jgi:hypothetical protein
MAYFFFFFFMGLPATLSTPRLPKCDLPQRTHYAFVSSVEAHRDKFFGNTSLFFRPTPTLFSTFL